MKRKHLLLLAPFLLIISACAYVPTLQDLQATAVAETLEAIYAETETAYEIQTAVAATVAAQGGPGGGEPVEATPVTSIEPPIHGVTPTPTPGALTPTPMATPVPQNLVLGEVGFGQEKGSIGLGFLVTNPNPELTISGAEYVMTVYDASGKILVLDDLLLPVLLPGQETGIARLVSLPEGGTAASVSIELENGEAVQTGPLAPLTARGPVYRQTDSQKTVLGEFDNPYPFFIDDIELAALLFDAEGRIVGSGIDYWNYASGMDSNGVQVFVKGASTAVRAELYPQVKKIPASVVENERPEGVQMPEVVSVEFVQPDAGFAYTAIEILNPNPNHVIPRTLFTMIGYTQDNSILFLGAGTLNTLGPGMRSVATSRMSWAGEDDLRRLEVHLKEDFAFEPSPPIPAILFENVQVTGDENFGYTFTADLVNPHPIDLENTWVHIVARDENGALIYADWKSVSLIPAGKTIVFEKWAPQFKVKPASVEIYALVPEYSELTDN